MTEATDPLLMEVAGYYTRKLAEHGQTPQGVDWNSADGQNLRFAQLFKLVDKPAAYTVNDLGCGYGAFFDFLQSRGEQFSYAGWDISPEMIHAARTRFGAHDRVRFEVSAEPDLPADYAFASGVLNVRFSRTDAEWRAYLESVLATLDRASTAGFAFNCLTSYSDKDRMKSNLYYADPCELFDLCKRRYSRNVALLHDYGLYEFTILVKKFQ